MTRLAAALKTDLVLQQRYGLWYAAGVSGLVWIAILRAMPPAVLPVAVPLVIYLDLAVVGFFLLAVLVLYERGEGTLAALVVTPLRFAEYLLSKLVSLTAVAVVLSLVVVLAGFGPRFRLLPALTGIVLLSAMVLLVAFVAVARFPTFSSFLFPSQVFALPFYLPLLDHLGVIPGAVFYALPSYGPLLLIRGAFNSVRPWEIVYAAGYGGAFIALMSLAARGAFDRHIVRRRG